MYDLYDWSLQSAIYWHFYYSLPVGNIVFDLHFLCAPFMITFYCLLCHGFMMNNLYAPKAIA